MGVKFPWVSPLAAIGNPPEHRDHRHHVYNHGVDISPSCLIEAFVTVDAGFFRATKIGSNTWLMKKVHVGHDCLIGSGCELAPNATLGGEVEVGNNVRIGLGAVVRPRVKIGDGARIGAGAVVVSDVPDGQVWVGNPAEEIKMFKARRDAVATAELWERWYADMQAEKAAA